MAKTSFLRYAGRAVIGGTVAWLGLGAVQNPGPRPEAAKPVLDKIREVVPVPFDDETAVRINGGVQVAAGAMMAIGVLPRVASVAMVGSLVPTTLAGHAFWNEEDPAKRKAQLGQFLKNAAIVAGLVGMLPKK